MAGRFGDVLVATLTIAAGVGWYLLQGGSTADVPYVVAAFVAVLVIAALPIWSRPRRTGGLRRAAPSPDGRTFLLEHRGGQRSAWRFADGAEVPAGEAPLPESTEATEIRRETEATFGDVYARLWLQGERRVTLHGLQPQPPESLEFVGGTLLVTRKILEEVPLPLPVLVRHRESLDEDSAELLTSVNLEGGAVRWTARFEAGVLERAEHLFVAGDLLVLLFQPERRARDAMGRVTRLLTGPCEAMALDAATGAVRWRSDLGGGQASKPATIGPLGLVGVASLALGALVALADWDLRLFPLGAAGGAAFWLLVYLSGPVLDRRVRASRVEKAYVVPVAGGLLVTEERIPRSVATYSGWSPAQWRLKARRPSDGAELRCLVAPADLRLLGAAPGLLWCSSRDMPVHARDPATLAVTQDARALVPGGLHGPVFDCRTRGVHAYAQDGRGVLITPDLQVVEAERSSVVEATPPRLFVPGPLAIDGEPAAGERARFEFRREQRGGRDVDVLVRESGGGVSRWEAVFPAKTLSRAERLLAAAGRVVLVLGPSPQPPPSRSFRQRRKREIEDWTAIGLDAATGAVAWKRVL